MGSKKSTFARLALNVKSFLMLDVYTGILSIINFFQHMPYIICYITNRIDKPKTYNLPLHPGLSFLQRLGFIWYKCEENCSKGQNFEDGFPRSRNLEYKSQGKVRRLSLLGETFTEARFPLFV